MSTAIQIGIEELMDQVRCVFARETRDHLEILRPALSLEEDLASDSYTQRAIYGVLRGMYKLLDKLSIPGQNLATQHRKHPPFPPHRKNSLFPLVSPYSAGARGAYGA
jgi:hypothetical protein